MGKTYRRSGDDADYYRDRKIQRDQVKRSKAKKKSGDFDRQDENSDYYGHNGNSTRKYR